MFNIESHIASVKARRTIANCGTACATQSELTYRNFRHDMMQREDWGRLPSDLHARMFALHRAYIEGRGK